MSTELILLSCTLLLALVQIMLSAVLRTRETGAAYNTGPRDTDGPPFGVLTGRMLRAQKNLFETLPLFIAAVLIVTLSKGENIYSLLGCWLYLLARIAYVPLYAAGIPVIRSLCWLISIFGLLLVMIANFL